MARGPLAGASGPGKFSARTDGLSMGSTAYGEGVETQAIKSGAPLAKTADVRGMPASEVREAAAAGPVTSLFAPSQRPNEPITTGCYNPADKTISSIAGGRHMIDYCRTIAHELAHMKQDVDGRIKTLKQYNHK